MIDSIGMAIPLKSDFVSLLEKGEHVSAFFNGDIHDFGFKNVGGKGLYKTQDGLVKADIEYHAFESLPTNFTGMGMKFYPASQHDFPHIFIECSPAKIMQGHNLFGSKDVGHCGREMLGFLYTAYPDLKNYLDDTKSEIRHIDITNSARLKSEQDVQQVIKFLKNVSSGQRKARYSGYDDTCYWGAEKTRLLSIKGYNKQMEYRNQLEKYGKQAKSDLHAAHIYSVMSDPRLIEWSKGLFRLESRFHKRWIERRDFPINLMELSKLQRSLKRQGRCIFTEWWQEATREIYAACEGQTMRTNDHESVLSKIRFAHQSFTRTGKVSYTKANRLYEFYRAIERDGIESVRKRYSDNVYFPNIRNLEICGFSKGYLQNLKQTYDDGSNVIPIFKLIEIDFKNQTPDWWVEPTSSFEYMAA